MASGTENRSLSTTVAHNDRSGSLAGEIRVVPVRGRRMTSQFLDMPRRVYADDPRWVPPLTSSARKFMSPHKNPYFAEATIDHFLALDDHDVPVGRISASIDHGYVLRYGPVGFFGWFECIDDDRVAGPLLDRAERWSAERGMRRIAGPYSYCSTQEFGLLTGGFDTTPAAFQAHNPPYYQQLLHRAGYDYSYRTDVYEWSAATSDPGTLEGVIARGERAKDRYGLTIRHLDPANWDAEMDRIYELFVASFAENHDVVPISRPVFDSQAKELKQFFDPQLIFFVERGGVPVGFGLLIADANEVLAVADGRLTPGFLLRFKALRSAVTGTIVLMIGARPEAVGLGIGRVLAGAIAEIALGRVGNYRSVHSTWIHQQNWQSRSMVAATGAIPRRTYAVLEKELTS